MCLLLWTKLCVLLPAAVLKVQRTKATFGEVQVCFDYYLFFFLGFALF